MIWMKKLSSKMTESNFSADKTGSSYQNIREKNVRSKPNWKFQEGGGSNKKIEKTLEKRKQIEY